MTLLRSIISVFFFVFAFNVNAQPFNYYSFNELYDFESTTIYNIKQDSKAYIWLATDNGLFKFDGVHFEQFLHPNFDKEYTNIRIDKNDNVWFTNFGGQLFKLSQYGVQVVYNNPNENYFITNYFLVDSNYVMVLGNNGKRIAYQSINGSKKPEIVFQSEDIMRASRNIKDENIIETVTFENKSDSSFFIHRSFNLKTRSFISTHKHYRQPGSMFKMSLINVGDENYLSYTADDHFIVRIDSSKADTIYQSNNTGNLRINSIGSDSENVYIQTQGRLIKMHLKSGQRQTLLKDFDFSCIFQDREKNLWVGTLNQGIIIIPPNKLSSRELSKTPIVEAHVSKNGKYYVYDVRSELKTGSVYKNKSPRMLDDESTHTPFVPHYNDLLLTNARLRIDTRTDKIYTTSFSHLYVKHLASINKYYAYATSSDGLYLLKLNNHKSELKKLADTFDTGKNMRIDIKKTRANLLSFNAKKNGLYVDFINGLKLYDLKDKFTKIQYKNKAVFATALASANLGVWCATSNNQLHKIEGSQITKSINTPEQIKQITKWKGWLFLASKKNLYKIDSSLSQLQSFSNSDGYDQEAIKAMRILGDSLYIIGTHHLQKIHCEKNHQPIAKPILHITGLKVNGKAIKYNDQLSLNTSQNDLSIEFDAINISAKQAIHYYYRIKENDDWKKLPYNVNRAQLDELKPGEYVFEIKACNADNICSTTEKRAFLIRSPFYKKWWFLLLLFMVLALLTFLIIRKYYKNIDKRNKQKAERIELEKEVYSAKISAIRAQMNPHFMFNALNTIQEFIITNQQEIASEYLADFADLMRMYLEQSKKDKISLNDEIEALNIYLKLENLRFDEELNYEIYCDKDLDRFGIEIPVMLIQPFVENSVKHGLLHKAGNKELTVSFKKLSSTKACCIIEDNGVGRKASAKINTSKKIKHNSFALKATSQRLKWLNKSQNQDFSVHTTDIFKHGKAAGTRVEVFFSLNT